MRQFRTALPFMLPGLALVLVFVVYPLVRGLEMSLYDWNLMFPAESTFVGAKNYVRALTQDPIFWTATRNTVLYAIITVPAQMGIDVLARELRRAVLGAVGELTGSATRGY